ncbi:MAG: sigma-70 family RNA polymerase sigma factor [Gemmatimonadota bacterium]
MNATNPNPSPEVAASRATDSVRPVAPAEHEFEPLLTPLLNSAYGTAVRLTRNDADAEDLVQESVLLAWRGFGSFERGTNFKAWFFRILTNCFFSKYRRRKREGTEVELEDTPELYIYCQTAAMGLHAVTEDPASVVMNKFDTENVTSAIDALPEEYRVVATLYFMQDFAYQEIAVVLDLPVGTVRSRLHRSRRLLQKALWELAKERGIVKELADSAQGNH